MRTLYQHLVRYAKDNELVGAPYHEEASFKWALHLDSQGVPNSSLVPLQSEGANGKKQAFRRETTPRVNRTSGVRPMLSADDIGYVLGWADAELSENKDLEEIQKKKKNLLGKDEATARRAAWAKLHFTWRDSPEAIDDPVPSAICSFLEGHADEIGMPEKWTSKDRVLVFVNGQLAARAGSASSFWSRHVESSQDGGRNGPCLVCGAVGALVKRFSQQVKGTAVPNGQSSGLAPISVNEIAYGYGLRKGLKHVPVCASCAVSIPTALNHLFTTSEHHSRSPESVTVWWQEGPLEFDPEELVERPDNESVRKLFASADAGQPMVALIAEDEFHSVTFGANSSRLVVRDWYHQPIGVVQRNISRWFVDTEVVGRFSYTYLHRIAQCTGRFENGEYLNLGDTKGHHPYGVKDALRGCALKGAPVPRDIIIHLLQRISADHHMDSARAALVRCYLRRTQSNMEGIMPGLNRDNLAPAYLLGRLLSVYEDLQYAAATQDGGSAPNATFVDKHLAGAITSPRMVLTAGARQSAAWLGKLRKSNRSYFFQTRIDEIISKLDSSDPGPIRATVDEQALFVLGYHHEREEAWRQRNERAVAKKQEVEGQ